jgi:hypothetical protein
MGFWNNDENSWSKSGRRSAEAMASEGVGDVMPATIANEGDGAVGEILEDVSQGLEPLDAEDNIKRAEGEPIDVDVEGLNADCDPESLATLGTGDTFVVHHRDP